MYFGSAYYPEHWEENRWETDARLMEEARFNIVRIGEFAWTKFERYEGKFEFSWIDKAIDILGRHNIKVIIGTPTAAPPKWLMDKYPDIYMHDNKGIVRGFGSRRHYCYNNEDYQRYCEIIVSKMAEHFADNKNVVGWQIDNEFGNANTTRCFCDNCKKKFQIWLKNKYKDIDELNKNWGTAFWSQTYNNWDEISLPKYTSDWLLNPSVELDFKRFSSDSVVNFQKLQVDIIKEKSPNQLITHNAMGAFNQIDYYNLSKDLDIISLDNYPNMTLIADKRPMVSALGCDVTRGFKKKNFWVTEQQSGTPGGDMLMPTPRPKEIRKWTYQSIARGADGIIYFRWRSCLFGAEEFWHGILNHDGLTNKKYDEVKQVGNEIYRISSLLEGTKIYSEVAIMRSYDNEWAFEIQRQVRDQSFNTNMEAYYKYFYDNNISVDIISPDSDLSSYKMVIVPNLFLTKDETIDSLYNYTKNGGFLIMDFRSGVKEFNNTVVPETLPGKFKELLGIEIKDYGIVESGESIGIKILNDSQSYKGKLWYDVITPKSAKPLAYYTDDYYKDAPAIVENVYGNGKAFYIGTLMDESLMNVIFSDILNKCGINSVLGIKNKEIEAIVRSNENKKYTFVINHSSLCQKIYLNRKYKEIVSEKSVQGYVDMEGLSVIILEE